jgi:TPR repeat protein
MRLAALSLMLLLWGGAACARPLAAGDLAAARAGAVAGDADARFDLGRMYRNGIGVARDSEAAARWIGLAAEAGHPAAMFTLHHMLAAGEGLKRDEGQAREWLERAAAVEDPQALQQLAQYLQIGAQGYARDPERAAQLLAQLAHALSHRPHAD